MKSLLLPRLRAVPTLHFDMATLMPNGETLVEPCSKEAVQIYLESQKITL
jgi:hypothetical protein